MREERVWAMNQFRKYLMVEGDGCSGFSRLERSEKGLKITLSVKKSRTWENGEIFLLSSAMPNVVCQAAKIREDRREIKIEEMIPKSTLEKEGLLGMVFDSLCVAGKEEIYCHGAEKEWDVKRAFQSYLETRGDAEKPQKEAAEEAKACAAAPKEDVLRKAPEEIPLIPMDEASKGRGAELGSIPKPKEPRIDWEPTYGIRYQCPFGTCLSGNCGEENNRKIVEFMASLNNALTLSCLKAHGYYLIGHDEKCFYIALPAVYGAEPPYFYQICQSARWIPSEHEGCHEDALGYWVVRMDLLSGEMA